MNDVLDFTASLMEKVSKSKNNTRAKASKVQTADR